MNLRFASAILFLIVSASALAAPQETRKPAATIVLPARAVAGQPVTLAVLSPDGELLPGTAIAIEIISSARTSGELTDITRQRKVTDRSGRVTLTLPPADGALLAEIPCEPQTGASISCQKLEYAAAILPAIAESKMLIDRVPEIISLHDRFEINGAGFRGEAEYDRVSLNNRPTLVLAASPVCLEVAAGPDTPPGSATVAISTGGSEATVMTTLVSIEFALTDGPLRPKQKTRLIVRLRGNDRPQSLEVVNQSPEILRFRHGDTQFVATSGGVDNSAEIEVRAIAAGDFSVSARLSPLKAPSPGIQSAVEFLRAAATQASPPSAQKIAALIERLNPPKSDARGVLKSLRHWQISRVSQPRAVEDHLQILLDAARAALSGAS
ncbi:MAG: hypothetical protein ACRD50_03300 [Candidatus Acidiferrales bacterium]